MLNYSQIHNDKGFKEKYSKIYRWGWINEGGKFIIIDHENLKLLDQTAENWREIDSVLFMLRSISITLGLCPN